MMKKYFIWSPPCTGKTRCVEKYDNMLDYDFEVAASRMNDMILNLEMCTPRRNISMSPLYFNDAKEMPNKVSSIIKGFKNNEDKIQGDHEIVIARPDIKCVNDIYVRSNLRGDGFLWARKFERNVQHVIDFTDEFCDQALKSGDLKHRVIDIKPKQYLSDVLKGTDIPLISVKSF